MILSQGRTKLVDLIYELARINSEQSGDIIINYKIVDERMTKPKPAKWHKVEDMLPAVESAVLVMSLDFAYPITAFYAIQHKAWYTLPERNSFKNVTMWRKMPKE